MVGLLNRVMNAGDRKANKALVRLAERVNAAEADVASLDDDALAAMTATLRGRLDAGEGIDDVTVLALAVAREAIRRQWGQRGYDVQVQSAGALIWGLVAEMRTGEGKTLAATMAAYVQALPQEGVHVVTANEYLAGRDAEWSRQALRRVGVSVGSVTASDMTTAERQAAYECDITYGTATAFGFDYLRDNLAEKTSQQVQRDLVCAIVDEADSVLIDEARTPMIISGGQRGDAALCQACAELAAGFSEGVHYEADLFKREATLLAEGIDAAEARFGLEGLFSMDNVTYVSHLNRAIEAKALYRRDVDYVVQDDEVRIVDQSTGRVMEGRRWGDGLHQAIEAKEAVTVNPENATVASVTVQGFFKMYDHLAGTTGTAQSAAGELDGTYGLVVVPIPTHRPLIRTDLTDVVFANREAKLEAVADEVAVRHLTGQPVLVGTTSVADSEAVSAALDNLNVPHSVLNAKRHDAEAEIIANAGALGAVTVATNMAGRGVDIILGGHLDESADSATVAAHAADAAKVRELGGLCVIGTARHDSRRVDDQLRGRSGRQGDPGVSRFYLSLDDDLLAAAGSFVNGALGRILSTDDGRPLNSKVVTTFVEKAQAQAEGRDALGRGDLWKYENVRDVQRQRLYELRQGRLEDESPFDSLHDDAVAVITNLVRTSRLDDEDSVAALVATAAELWGSKLTDSDLLDTYIEQAQEALLGDFEARWAERLAVHGESTMTIVVFNTRLGVLDSKWRSHLEGLDELREGINLRSMAGSDPLHAWTSEAFERYEAMLLDAQRTTLKWAMTSTITVAA